MVKGPDCLPDAQQRRMILERLDVNMLVEAAAGTGKTTCMVGRMVALLRTGTCHSVKKMAAVTFTRKAAAELRSRFRVELERAYRDSEGEERERLRRSLDELEHCFIGTIHSFCGRLLRERPVEARVELGFKELDEAEDKRLRERAWEDFAARTIARDESGLLSRLQRLGLRLSDLRSAFISFCDYPDVQEWPGSEKETPMPDTAPVIAELRNYLDHMESLKPRLPSDTGTCELMPLYRRLPLIARGYDLSRTDQLMEMLSNFDKSPKQTQKAWKSEGKFTQDEAKDEAERWKRFREEHVKPMLQAWRVHRYHTVMEVLFAARDQYDRLREEAGCLNFQDLLMRAASLLRDHPHIRRYFQERFTHILVDEFQDTDPIQAEVLFLLAASDPEEKDWRRCRPRPGSLFVVGDPKQSIYRFRRADIVTYSRAKGLLVENRDRDRGLLVRLSANFRAVPRLIDWTNEVFSPAGEGSGDDISFLRFPRYETEASPAYVELRPGREEEAEGALAGVRCIRIGDDLKREDEVIDWEAGLIARFIRKAVDEKMTVSRSPAEIDAGIPPQVGPGDFMILTRAHHHLGLYAQKLQLQGIPHQVSGGDALNKLEELGLLTLFLRAVVRPDDPTALVAVLRSELFGVSDADLFEFKRAGGRFHYHAELPEGISEEAARAIGDAFRHLRECERRLSVLPPVAALERTVESLGLLPLAASRRGGSQQAGSLLKALELIRGMQDETWSHARLLEYLEGILKNEEESIDGIAARPPSGGEVRLMTLHRAKGLESPVVFLADPYKGGEHEPALAVDRGGERIRGYLSVWGDEKERKNPTLLAIPPDWDEVSARESEFERAERLRLRYVAATRAGSALIVTLRSKYNDRNFWDPFSAFIPDESALEDPGDIPPPPSSETATDAEKAGEVLLEIDRKSAEAAIPTHEVRAAKDHALSHLSADSGGISEQATAEEILSEGRGEGGHGTEWGTVIHLLLENMGKGVTEGLEELAASSLAENDLDPDLAPEAVDMAVSVTRSELWSRSLAAGSRLVEVPFCYAPPEDEGFPGKRQGMPLLLRGVIDLAFRESGGWVLADFKTDDLPASRLEGAAKRYAPQLQLYSLIFEACTGEPVRERVIYFVRSGKQFVV